MKQVVPALLPAILLIALVSVFAPDGNVKNDWFRFMGGFHPLIVHFPIALILFIPVFEIVGRFNTNLNIKPSVEIIIKVALLASIIAPFFGWALAWGDGFSGEMVTSHMWAGALVPLACGILLLTHQKNWGLIYTLMLTITIGLVSWTGFLGGQLAHGRTHLTAHMPDNLREKLGIEKPVSMALADPNTFFGGRVAPVFATRCVACHGPDKIKGKLRLDSYAFLSAGGANGAVISPGSSETSELYRRITLPSFHDEFMPSEGNPALGADEIELIALWIDHGASPDMALNAIEGAPVIDTASLPIEVTVPDYDPVAAAEDRADLANAVAEIQEKYPHILTYVSRNTGDLDLNATMMRGSFGDTDFALFGSVLNRVVRADFTATAITDQSAPLLLGMSNINILRLNQTNISENIVLDISNLNGLKSLNLLGVTISNDTKNILAQIENLDHLYLE